jgi:indole-3-glycerol phosphate synthase/phosphoribosylanthranilate isomerase
MGQADLDRACCRLLFGRVKVCGLTQPEDAKAVYDAGGTFGGVIFVKKSPRYVSLETAKAVREGAPLKWVGVFVNAPVEEVAGITRALTLTAVQLHGDEDGEYIQELKQHLKQGVAVWRTVWVGDTAPNLDVAPADRVLLDTASPKARGGTGETFDWSIIDSKDLKEVVLGGGLNPDIARDADRLGAFALDVNSGVEEAPGKKSFERLRQFFDELRG